MIIKTHWFLSNFFGTVLLIYGGICCVALLFMHTDYMQTMEQVMLSLPRIFFLGLLLLGVSQFLRHVSGQTDNPGWILRKGEFIIYLVILVWIVQAIWRLSAGGTTCSGGICLLPTVQRPTVETVIALTIFLVRILIMFGIARSLRAMGYSSSRRLTDSD